MAEQKEHGITWTDRTWNPIRGCTRVSQGCVNCYAERIAHRFNKPGLAYEGLTDHNGRWNGVIRVVEDNMLDPLKWKKPARVFVNSMSDLFHDNVNDDTIDRIFAVMALAEKHTFQILTKRPERMLEYSNSDWQTRLIPYLREYGKVPKGQGVSLSTRGLALRNVWLGVSVENQATADERIPLLLQTRACVRWISAEPLLGALDLQKFLYVGPEGGLEYAYSRRHMLDWVVVGGESGPGARPMQKEWARSLRDQCVAASVAFHFKQWGEWLPPMTDGADYKGTLELNCSDKSARVGKHYAGRNLDGRTWDEYPEARS